MAADSTNLRKFAGGVELSLGLSLGGGFGGGGAVDPNEDHRLTRSTSNVALPEQSPAKSAANPAAVTPLLKACSLPIESEEEYRMRKEWQSLKRMEAKRKRWEKRAARELRREEGGSSSDDVTGGGGGGGGGGNAVENGGINVGVAAAVSQPVPPPRWGVGTTPGVGWSPPVLQGSNRSQGSGGSSGVSDFDSMPMQGIVASGLSNCEEVRGLPSSSNHTLQKPPTITPISILRKPGNPARSEVVKPATKKVRIAPRQNGLTEMEKTIMEEMPCVSTRGVGPNGRIIKGFLYKYREGEVRIVCVCHGNFLTPSQFVRHACGVEVAHPLRHIVVTPTPW